MRDLAGLLEALSTATGEVFSFSSVPPSRALSTARTRCLAEIGELSLERSRAARRTPTS
jgi:hypothetical protein